MILIGHEKSVINNNNDIFSVPFYSQIFTDIDMFRYCTKYLPN